MAWTSAPLQSWLLPDRASVGSYRHVLLAEDPAHRTDGLEALARLVRAAHEEERRRIESLMGMSLDPLDPQAVADPLRCVYPDDLDTITLQGYLGEIMAGLFAENYEPHDTAWVVPAFLFRGHVAAAQSLERRRQLGGPARPAPGRTGDDALAFQLDDDGHVVAWLFGEAKCSQDHSSSLVADGHVQLSTPIWSPIDLAQLIETLRARGEPGDPEWVAALQEFFLRDASTAPPRSDLFVYVCGRRPRRRGVKTWMSKEKAHAKYAGRRPLEAVEVHLSDVDGVLRAVYPAHTIFRRAAGRKSRKAAAK